MDKSQKQRDRIITLFRDAQLSRKEIYRTTNIPLSTVRRIVKRFIETGQSSTIRTGRCGRRKSSSQQHDRMILRTSIINPCLTAVDLKCHLNSPLSVHTIRKRLNEGERIATKPIKKLLLTDTNYLYFLSLLISILLISLKFNMKKNFG